VDDLNRARTSAGVELQLLLYLSVELMIPSCSSLVESWNGTSLDKITDINTGASMHGVGRYKQML
jgi:hypothetical protein